MSGATLLRSRPAERTQWDKCLKFSRAWGGGVSRTRICRRGGDGDRPRLPSSLDPIDYRYASLRQRSTCARESSICARRFIFVSSPIRILSQLPWRLHRWKRSPIVCQGPYRSGASAGEIREDATAHAAMMTLGMCFALRRQQGRDQRPRSVGQLVTLCHRTLLLAFSVEPRVV